MVEIVTRAGKGSPLTNAEVDANFTNLNTAVVAAQATADAAQADATQALSAAAGKVSKGGDTMTGALTLPGTNPTSDNHAARKAYVDAQVGAKVSKSGDTMTGALAVPYIRGGASDAGTLKCWGTTNNVNFRWNAGYLRYRVDETVEKAIATTDDLDSRVSKSGDTMTGALAVPYIRGGAHDAGTLRCWGSTHSVNFRWDDANLFYRVDEAIERTISYTSDARIKTDIRPSEEDALSVLRNIPLYSYSFVEGLPETFKEGHAGRVPLGLTAQDLEARGLGFAVWTSNQPDGRPECVPSDLKSVQMDALVPYLIRAVQQQQEQIEALRAKVAELEAAVS